MSLGRVGLDKHRSAHFMRTALPQGGTLRVTAPALVCPLRLLFTAMGVLCRPCSAQCSSCRATARGRGSDACRDTHGLLPRAHPSQARQHGVKGCQR